ncbi:hypothetical protein Pint_29671 [Pistacia integerrima]|uniref:Uncharacterized protein n=1 Tax=Pistacia integerrima TaxID=434235 RepID=A0ACC0X0C7_9ROSI|nr:hypothetical protein Pint_29671 [Pistacia integerrima]
MWILSVCPLSVATCGAIKSNPSSSKSINQDYRISIRFTTSRCPCLQAMKNDLPFSLISFVANHELVSKSSITTLGFPLTTKLLAMQSRASCSTQQYPSPFQSA